MGRIYIHAPFYFLHGSLGLIHRGFVPVAPFLGYQCGDADDSQSDEGPDPCEDERSCCDSQPFCRHRYPAEPCGGRTGRGRPGETADGGPVEAVPNVPTSAQAPAGAPMAPASPNTPPVLATPVLSMALTVWSLGSTPPLYQPVTTMLCSYTANVPESTAALLASHKACSRFANAAQADALVVRYSSAAFSWLLQLFAWVSSLMGQVPSSCVLGVRGQLPFSLREIVRGTDGSLSAGRDAYNNLTISNSRHNAGSQKAHNFEETGT